ncbi:hypothetical protein D9756_000174 [Leucocoprinus leucothites]|uniref:Uncharacterized protein n=1 Tax=Leucocoprinus leucothites TaxID=201217 RepID=A0A8H5GEI4_9AGAR|nr:hypothetical protein D9756_000174 [Leucoagaricus leucothites]
MGNVNEKNVQKLGGAKEKEMLDPRGHFDPWTVKEEARTIEEVLSPGVELRCPPSPESEPEHKPQLGSDTDVPLPSLPAEEVGLELFQLSQPDVDPVTEINRETEDSRNEYSLPLPDSVIPDTFELLEDEEFFTPSFPDDAIAEVPILTPTTPAIRSLGTIEELDEDAPAPDADERLVDLSPLTIGTAEPWQLPVDNEHALQLSEPADRATAITEQILQNSPPLLASNSSGAALQRNTDILDVPGSILLQPRMMDKLPEVATVLSPLVLDPPALTIVDDMVFGVASGSKPDSVEDLYLDEKGDETPRVSMPPIACLAAEVKNERLHGANDNSYLALLAPYLDTIPLPPFPIEENARLFVSDSFAKSGLGLIVSNIAAAVEKPQGGLTSPQSHGISRDCLGYTPVEPEQGLATSPCGTDAEDTSGGLDGKPSPSAVSPSCLSAGIQISTIEEELNLIQLAFNNLEIANDGPSPPVSQLTRPALAAWETGVGTPKPSLEKLSSVIAEIRTYADATDVAMRHPEIAKEVLQIPLPFTSRSTLTVDRSTQKVEREGPKHTLDWPNWTNAPAEGTNTPNLPLSRVSGDLLNHGTHTPDTPNWAVAPVIEHAMSPKIGKTQRERGRTRDKKGRKGRGSNNAQTSQPIRSSSARAVPSIPVVPKLTKEKSKARSKARPPLQIAPTEEQRKVVANHQKVSKWINDSASAMVSPKSDAERASIPRAPSSAFFMDPVPEQTINKGPDGRANIEKEPLYPASRIIKALAAEEAHKRGFHDEALLEGEVHSKPKEADQAPMISAKESVGVPSALEIDQEATVDEGKKPMVRSPSPSGRERSASIASSLVSGISARSGVPASSRLFRRAIQEIGSLAYPRSVSGNDASNRQLPVQSQAKEPEEIADGSTQPPETLSWKSPRLDSTPITTTAVICPENRFTQQATEDTKGKVKTSTPLHQMADPVKGARSNSERFTFNFKPPGASIAKEDQKSGVGRREVISPFTMRLGSGTVPTVRAGDNVMKTSRTTSTSTFIPQGKYTPPPIREGQMQRQARVPTSLATGAIPGNSSTTSFKHKTSQSVQYPDSTGAAPTATLGLSAKTRPFVCSDVTATNNHHNLEAPSPSQNLRNVGDVNADMRFGAGGQPLPATEEESESLRSVTYGHNRQLNLHAEYMNTIQSGNTGCYSRLVNDSPDTYSRNMLVYDGLDQIKAAEVVSESRAHHYPPPPVPPQQRIGGYTAQLERLQQDMADFRNLTRGYSQQETFNPTVTANRFQNLNLRAPRARVNLDQATGFNEAKNLLQSDVVPQIQNAILTPRSRPLPPHLQNQNIATHNMFEEYSRPQRQETRVVHESIPSRLPRRKI